MGAATLFDVSDWIARRGAIFFAGQRHRNAVRLDYPKLENRKCRPIANSSSGTDKSLALMRRVYSCCEHTFDRPCGNLLASMGRAQFLRVFIPSPCDDRAFPPRSRSLLDRFEDVWPTPHRAFRMR